MPVAYRRMKNKHNGTPPSASAHTSQPSQPTRSKHTGFYQLSNLIPAHMIPGLARKYAIDSRGFNGNGHVLGLIYGHASHALSLNDICDALSLHEAEFFRVRGSTSPKRNTFSNANRTRDPAMAEDLYWSMLAHLMQICPSFGGYDHHAGFISRLKRDIFAMDSTTLQLTLASIDWARHRRRKAAAKCHMRLNIGSFLPAFTIVEDAAHHDSVRAAALCASMVAGDVLLADREYVDLDFLAGLNARAVFFVLRPKRKMLFDTVKKLPCTGKILHDELVRPAGVNTAKSYPGVLRMVTALVEVDGKEREMSFITNNTTWCARTIAELYRARWSIEVFFKELKQTLQLRDFVGTNENAVKWQVWTGLLTHLMMRYLHHISGWRHSFSRCVGFLRNALWMKIDLLGMLRCYGTAGGPYRPILSAKELYLPGFEALSNSLMGQPV